MERVTGRSVGLVLVLDEAEIASEWISRAAARLG